MYEVWFYDANDEILTNATAFTTNEPRYGGIVEIFVFDHTYDTILYEAQSTRDFMMKMMKF